VQGNCSQADPVSALDLGNTDSAGLGLLPLKPYQCLVIVSKPWLEVTRAWQSEVADTQGSVWVDNLYLRLSRKQMYPKFAFITVGRDYGGSSMESPASAFVTNVTFHAEQAHSGTMRSAMAVFTGEWHSQVYLDGTPRSV